MKNIIQIIYVQPITGTSRKTGNAYDMRAAQCIVERFDDNGTAIPLVGELMLPDAFKDIPPGRYEVTFELHVGSDKRIGSRVSSMTPIAREAREARPVASPAKA
jgi:hypothetical protein